MLAVCSLGAPALQPPAGYMGDCRLFIAHSGSTTAADPAQTERRSGEAPLPAPVQETLAMAPQSTGLFVARPDSRGPR